MNKSKKTAILVMFLLIIMTGTVMAKYVVNHEKQSLYVADNFYFESDLLNSDTDTKTYTYQKGKNNIKILIKNNIDDLRYSDVDIDYTVRITDLHGNEAKKSITGTLEKGSIKSQTINFEDLQTGTYTIIATATAPYEKTLKANFVIEEKNANVSYDVVDVENSSVAQLIITTNDYNGNLKITWPNGVAPDSTNNYFADVDTGYNASNKTITVSAKSQTILYFFKQNSSQKYTIEDFKID